MPSPIAHVAAGAFVILAVLYGLTFVLFYVRLRKRHKAEWEAMGSPNPFFHSAFGRRMAPIRRLLRGKGLAELNDRYLAFLAHATKGRWCLALPCLAVAAAYTWLLKL